MRQLILPLFVLVTVGFWSADAYTAKYNVTKIDKHCSKAGRMCKNCVDVINCVKNGNSFIEHHIESCSGPNSYCLVDQCTTDYNPHCPPPEHVFRCQDRAVGIFPDPFDCKIFHVCTGHDEPQTFICDENFGFDIASSYCKLELKYDACPEKPPVPTCKNAGDSGHLINNKSIYYMCVRNGNVINPELHLCPYGKIYYNNECH